MIFKIIISRRKNNIYQGKNIPCIHTAVHDEITKIINLMTTNWLKSKIGLRIYYMYTYYMCMVVCVCVCVYNGRISIKQESAVTANQLLIVFGFY